MTLYVKPISALLTHDTELFSNMDPYVVISIGREKKKTATHKEGGKKPKWKEVFTFRPSRNDQMEITVYDQDTFSDDVVGTTRVNLSAYMDGEEKKQYFNLTYKKKSAGKIYVSLRYSGSETSNNSFSGQVQNGWGVPVQGHSGWGQPQPQQGWGGNNNSNWSQPVQGGWGQQQQQTPPQSYSAWANNNNSGWGSNNNGWGNQAPQQTGGWGNTQSNNGWRSNPQQQQNNGWGKNAAQKSSSSNDWVAPPANNNNGWGEQPPQGQQPDLIGLLANVLNNPNQPSNNSNNGGWGPNNNAWGNANSNGW